jgi:hypothetical protein
MKRNKIHPAILVPALIGSLYIKPGPAETGFPNGHYRASHPALTRRCCEDSILRLISPEIDRLSLKLRGGGAKKQRIYESEGGSTYGSGSRHVSESSDDDWGDKSEPGIKVPSGSFKRRTFETESESRQDFDRKMEHSKSDDPDDGEDQEKRRMKPGTLIENPIKYDQLPHDEPQERSTSSIPSQEHSREEGGLDEERKTLLDAMNERLAETSTTEEEVFRTTPEGEESLALLREAIKRKPNADPNEESSEFRGPGAPQPGTRAYEAWLMHETRKQVPPVFEQDDDLSEIEYLAEQTRGMVEIIAKDVKENPQRYERRPKNETLAAEWRLGMRFPEATEVVYRESSEDDARLQTVAASRKVSFNKTLRADSENVQEKPTQAPDVSDEEMRQHSAEAPSKESNEPFEFPVTPGAGGIGVLFEDRPLTTSLSQDPKKGAPHPHRDWGIVVDALVDGCSAAQSGAILPGDVLVKADGIDVRGKRVVDCASLVLGAVGTHVRLTLTRAGKPYEVTLERRGVAGQTVDEKTVKNLVKDQKISEKITASTANEKVRLQDKKEDSDSDLEQLPFKEGPEPPHYLDLESDSDSEEDLYMVKLQSVQRDAEVQRRRDNGVPYTARELRKARVILEDHNGFRSPHRNITHALACSPGVDDTITLRRGVYNENITIHGCVTIEAEEGLTPRQVALACMSGPPVVTCIGKKADVRLVGLSIRHTGGEVYNKTKEPVSWARGVQVLKGAKLTLARCR